MSKKKSSKGHLINKFIINDYLKFPVTFIPDSTTSFRRNEFTMDRTGKGLKIRRLLRKKRIEIQENI